MGDSEESCEVAGEFLKPAKAVFEGFFVVAFLGTVPAGLKHLFCSFPGTAVPGFHIPSLRD